MDGETEGYKTTWDWWCRIARYDPDHDQIDWKTRAPRVVAPERDGCINQVPARDGAVLVLVHQHDFRREHERFLVRRDGAYVEVPGEEAWEALAPGYIARKNAAEEARMAAHWAAIRADEPYQKHRYKQPSRRKDDKVLDGIQQDTADNWVEVSNANGSSYQMRLLRPWEVERHLAALAAEESAPAA